MNQENYDYLKGINKAIDIKIEVVPRTRLNTPTFIFIKSETL